MTALRALLEERAPRAGSTRVIGIDGHGGSGKSTLADYLGGRLGAETVHTDDFASWDNPKDWWPLVLARVLEPLRSGARTLSYPRSQWWPGHRPDPVVDQPVTDILILEGVGSLRREFRPYLSVALFVDAPRALCIERGLSRDAALGTTNELLDRWNAWFDDEIVHLARHESRQFADLVLDGTVPFEGQLDS